MENFKIERKGYNPKEVENFIQSIKLTYDKQLNEQRAILIKLKNENSELKQKLSAYEKKDGDISSALVVAVQTAKEIENSAKTVYELEIKRVKLLYAKWQAVLRQLIAIYPDLASNSGAYKLFKDFEQNIVKILERENKIENLASEQGYIDDKTYAKNLLQRIKETNFSRPTPSFTQPSQPVVQIKRADTRDNFAAKIPSTPPKKVEKVVPKQYNQVSEFEKFMNSEFDDFNAFQSGNINQKHTKNLFTDNLVSVPNDDGAFDLKEALTPKEDLGEIMKIFDLDDD